MISQKNYLSLNDNNGKGAILRSTALLSNHSPLYHRHPPLLCCHPHNHRECGYVEASCLLASKLASKVLSIDSHRSGAMLMSLALKAFRGVVAFQCWSGSKPFVLLFSHSPARQPTNQRATSGLLQMMFSLSVHDRNDDAADAASLLMKMIGICWASAIIVIMIIITQRKNK